MTIVADHPLSGKTGRAFTEAQAKHTAVRGEQTVLLARLVWLCNLTGYTPLHVPVSMIPKSVAPNRVVHVVSQLDEATGRERFYVAVDDASEIARWSEHGVGTGPHWAEGDPVGERFGHVYLGKYVFLGELAGEAVLVPVAFPPAVPDGSERVVEEQPSPAICPAEVSWCEEDHGSHHTSPNFHMWRDRREPGVGVLRADIVLNDAELTLDVNEYLEWSVPLEEAPQFITALREEVERLEARVQQFVATATEAQAVAA